MPRPILLVGGAHPRTARSGGARIPTLAIVGIIVVVVVVILIAMFAMIYYLAAGVIKVPEAQLSEPRAVTGTMWEITVESADPTWALYNYMAVLYENDYLVDILEPLTSTSTEIAFVDLNGERDLTPGDYFRITCEPGGSYSLLIVYRTGLRELDNVEWET